MPRSMLGAPQRHCSKAGNDLEIKSLGLENLGHLRGHLIGLFLSGM